MGGFRQHAQDRYRSLRSLLEEAIEKDAEATLQLRVTRSGDVLEIDADASAVKKTGDQVRLRLVGGLDHVIGMRVPPPQPRPQERYGLAHAPLRLGAPGGPVARHVADRGNRAHGENDQRPADRRAAAQMDGNAQHRLFQHALSHALSLVIR